MAQSMQNLFNTLMRPLAGLHPEASCALLSTIIVALLLLLFKYISLQRHIEVVKDRMTACVLGVWLYRDQPRMIGRCQLAATLHGFHYLGLSILPLLIIAIPMCLTLTEMNAWYAYRPLSSGESTLVRMSFAESVPPEQVGAVLRPPAGVNVDAAHVDKSRGEVLWRLTCRETTSEPLRFDVGGLTIDMPLSVGGDAARIAATRRVFGFWNRLEFWDDPVADPPLPADGPVRSIHVQYPQRRWWLSIWWIDSFAFMLAAVLLLRKPMGVAI